MSLYHSAAILNECLCIQFTPQHELELCVDPSTCSFFSQQIQLIFHQYCFWIHSWLNPQMQRANYIVKNYKCVFYCRVGGVLGSVTLTPPLFKDRLHIHMYVCEQLYVCMHNAYIDALHIVYICKYIHLFDTTSL